MTAQAAAAFEKPGKFRPLERHEGSRRVVRGSLFSGASPLKLHDPDMGDATVERAVLGELAIGSVRSTGHDVTVRESTSVSLVLPLQGAMTTETGGRTITAGAGMGLLLPRGHRQTRVACPGTGQYSAFILMLDSTALSTCSAMERARGLVLDGSGSRDVAVALQMTMMLADQLRSGSRVLDRAGAARSWFELITSSIDQSVESMLGDIPESATDSHDAYRYVARAEEYMRWNLADIITTVDVASHLGISRRTLETAFRRVRGDSPLKILTRLRLQAARQLLLDPDGPASVTDVCLDVGIGHHGRFSSAYRKLFGEPPSETLRRR